MLKNWYLLLLIILFSCDFGNRNKNVSSFRPISFANANDLKLFLEKAAINSNENFYFTIGKPSFTLPNVYAFNSEGKEIETRGSDCFAKLDSFASELTKGNYTLKNSDKTLKQFLGSVEVVDSKNQFLNIDSLAGLKRDFYLYVDYLPIMPMDSIVAENYYAQFRNVNDSAAKKNFQVFFVSAMSQENQSYYDVKLP